MNGLSKVLKIIILIIAVGIIIISSDKILWLSSKSKINSEKIKGIKDKNEYFFKTEFENYFSFILDTTEDKYTLFDKENNFINYILFTSPYCKDIQGFGGEVPLAICLEKNNKIQKIILLQNSETQSWVDKLITKKFFENWNNLTLQEAIDKQVDAVSGATFTSSAVLKSVKLRLEKYTKTISIKKTYKVLNILGIIASFLVVLFAILNFLLKKPSKFLRLLLLFASVGILGFWQGKFLSISLLSNWLYNGMNIQNHILLLIILLISIIIPIVSNKSFYCNYLCPFGAAQELLGKINKHNIDLGGTLQFLKYIKFLLLFVMFLFIVLSVDVALENFEPFSAFKFQYASLVVLILAIIILFLSIFIKKPWCRFFCPTGALLSMFGGKSLNINIKIKNIFHIISGVLLLIIIILTILLLSKNSKEDSKINHIEKHIFENNAIDVILARKSVREYKDLKISRDTLEILIKSGMSAPTARNLQPWYFIVLENKEDLENLGERLPNAAMLKNAAAAIIVCGNLKKAYLEIDSAYWVQDCCAATENILLAAEAMELGAVWTAVYPYPDRQKTVIEYLKLPQNYKPLNIIPIGYPLKAEKPKNKWKKENVIFY